MPRRRQQPRHRCVPVYSYFRSIALAGQCGRAPRASCRPVLLRAHFARFFRDTTNYRLRPRLLACKARELAGSEDSWGTAMPKHASACYTFVRFVRAQNCRQICGLCAQTTSSPSPLWSPFSSTSARSPLCSLRGCSSTFEVSICLACAFAACHIVTSCTPHLRARPCQLSDGAFADAPVLTACRLPLFAIVFLYQLSAADAAPTDSTDPGDAFIGAAAAVGTLATAAAKRLSSAGPASTCGKNSAGSKPLSLCVLFHLAQLCSRGTATPQVTRRPRPSGRSPPQSPASRPVTLRSKSSHVHVDRPRLPPLLRGSSARQMRLGRLRRSPCPTKPCSACLPPWPSSRCTGSESSLTP